MKKLERSEWRFSVIILAGLLGTFLAISVVQHELHLTYALGYLAVWLLAVSSNAIDVLYKRNKNKRG